MLIANENGSDDNPYVAKIEDLIQLNSKHFKYFSRLFWGPNFGPIPNGKRCRLRSIAAQIRITLSGVCLSVCLSVR